MLEDGINVYISGAQHTPPSPDDMYRFAEMVAGLEEIQLDRYLAMIEQVQGIS